MINELIQVADLQPAYEPGNSPAMRLRGEILRGPLANELRSLGPTLSAAMGEYGDDFYVDASDGIGRKTEAPWVRFASRRMSPNARNGFYGVIHFSADGSAFWLTVGCGSTIWTGGDLRDIPASELAKRTGWARGVIEGAFGSLGPFNDQIELGARASLPKTFERATVCARKFVPSKADEETIQATLERGAVFLREIYRAQSVGADLTAAQAAEMEVEAISRPSRSGRLGQSFGLSAPERRAVELQAMVVARAWLEGLGYSVEDKSSASPFDFEARKGHTAIKVEVKGTTAASCDEFFMTRNEVALHSAEAGTTGLALVSGIALVRHSDGTCTASGGTCFGEIGWRIADCTLEPIAFRVIRPKRTQP